MPNERNQRGTLQNMIKLHLILNLVLLACVISVQTRDIAEVEDAQEESGYVDEDSGKIKVVVLDTGLDLKDPRFEGYLCKNGHKDFTGYGIEDVKGHGTHVAGLIQKHAGPSGYCFIIVKYYHTDGRFYVPAFKYAFSLKADIINLSGTGPDYYPWEKELIAMNDKTLLVVAAGNNGMDLDVHETYPASYALPNMRIVGNLGLDYNKAYTSNYGSIVTDWYVGINIISYAINYDTLAIMSGTSMSTAIASGEIVKEKLNEKYFATHN